MSAVTLSHDVASSFQCRLAKPERCSGAAQSSWFAAMHHSSARDWRARRLQPRKVRDARSRRSRAPLLGGSRESRTMQLRALRRDTAPCCKTLGMSLSGCGIQARAACTGTADVTRRSSAASIFACPASTALSRHVPTGVRRRRTADKSSRLIPILRLSGARSGRRVALICTHCLARAITWCGHGDYGRSFRALFSERSLSSTHIGADHSCRGDDVGGDRAGMRSVAVPSRAPICGYDHIR